MTFARLVLVLSALTFAGAGAAFLLRPVEMTSIIGVELAKTVSRSDIRAVYGGLQVGFGGFLAYASAQPSRVALALAAQLAVFAGLLLGRVASLLADGVPEAPGWMLVAVEALGLTLGVAALAALRSHPYTRQEDTP